MSPFLKFPGYVFNPNHGMTLRDRVAKLCEYSLRRQLTRFQVAAPPDTKDYVYRSMVSADSLPIGVYSIASLARCAKAMPQIELCVDESLETTEVQSMFAHHGLKVKVLTSDDLDAELAKRNQEILRHFAKAFFWGRKTGFTFGLGQEVPVLYADLDVLWLQDPWQAMRLGENRGLLAGTDGNRSFDEGVLDLISESHRRLLLETEPVCAGLYAVGAGFKLPQEIIHYIEQQLSTGTPGYFCEQTLLALAVKLAGKQLSFEELPTCPRDQTVLRPAYQGHCWIAGHYAGPTRPQFWRDAWALFGS